MLKSSKIKPFLWFEHQAEQAARFHTSVFRDSRPGKIARIDIAGLREAAR